MSRSQPFPKGQEQEYQLDLLPEKLRMLRETNALCTFLYLAFGWLDFWTMPSQAWVVLGIRGVVAAVNLSVIAATYSRYQQVLVERYAAVSTFQYLLWGLGIEVIILLTSDSDPARYTYYAGLILVSIALYSWTYLRWETALAIGITLAASYIAGAVWLQDLASPVQWPFLISNCFFLISANIMGAYSQDTRDRFARDNFLYKLALRRDLEVNENAKRQSDYVFDHDGLTDLYNKSGLLRRLNVMLVSARQANEAVCVLSLDIEHFGAVNRDYGLDVGDSVLQIVAHRLKTGFQTSDIRARVGADEFVVALNLGPYDRVTSLQSVKAIERRICATLTGLMLVDAHRLQLKVKVGCAVFPFEAESSETLLSLAAHNRTWLRAPDVSAQLDSDEHIG